MEKQIGLKIDANIDYDELFLHVKNALMGGLDIVFLTNPMSYNQNQLARLIELCHNYQSVLLFVDDLKYALINDCDGIYFDKKPMVVDETIKNEDFMVGVKYNSNHAKINTQNIKLNFVVISEEIKFELPNLAKTISIYTEVTFQKDLQNIKSTTKNSYILNFIPEMANDLRDYIKEVKYKMNS